MGSLEVSEDSQRLHHTVCIILICWKFQLSVGNFREQTVEISCLGRMDSGCIVPFGKECSAVVCLSFLQDFCCFLRKLKWPTESTSGREEHAKWCHLCGYINTRLHISSSFQVKWFSRLNFICSSRKKLDAMYTPTGFRMTTVRVSKISVKGLILPFYTERDT